MQAFVFLADRHAPMTKWDEPKGAGGILFVTVEGFFLVTNSIVFSVSLSVPRENGRNRTEHMHAVLPFFLMASFPI